MDLIDRKAAIEAHYEYCNKHPDAGFPVWSLKILEDLPSAQPEVLACGEGELIAQPERKKGKWIDSWRSKMDGTRYWYRECDHCGYERNDCDPEKDSNFCPNCGADMREDGATNADVES